MCTPIVGLAPPCPVTPSYPYQGLISHFQYYLQTFLATVVVLGKSLLYFTIVGHSLLLLPIAHDDDTEVGF